MIIISTIKNNYYFYYFLLLSSKFEVGLTKDKETALEGSKDSVLLIYCIFIILKKKKN